MTDSREVKIEYIRPGKGVQEYVEDLVTENEHYLKTFKIFPDDIAEKLTQSLSENGFIAENQRTTAISKVYFFHEHFNLLQFLDENHQTLGYYSDIGTPLIKTPDSYQMTDWFLDIWLSPGGKLFELDLDEFEVARSNNLLSPSDAKIAQTTFARLTAEARQGIYPNLYLK
jgi:predicted RNA-binding protein associated with RNAse of E/G family